MSEIFNEAVGLAKEKLSPQEDVLDALYGKTEEAYEKFEKEPLLKQLALSMTPGIGNVIAAKEVDVFGGRAKEAFEEAKYGQAAGYGGLTALAALGTLPGVGLIGRGAKGAIRGGLKLLDDPMEQAIKEVGEKATLPKTPSRVFGKELDEYTGPHSDFVRPEQGLKSLDEPTKAVSKEIDTMNSLNPEDLKRFVENPEDLINIPKVTQKHIDAYRQPVGTITEVDGIKIRGARLPKQSDLTKSSDLEEAARTLKELGPEYQKEFKRIRDITKPKKPYGTVPDLKTDFEIAAAMGKVAKRGIIGLNKFPKQGEKVSSRFDINAYDYYDNYVATISKNDKVFGYGPTAVLRNVEFDVAGPKAFDIARGQRTKWPFAKIHGEWQELSPKAAHKKAIDNIKSKDWVEVGFDPSGRGGFYRRDTGEVIGGAEEIIQVGPMVLAKGLRELTEKQLKNLEVITDKGIILFNKQGGQIVTGLAGLGENIVYRQFGGGLDSTDAEAYAEEYGIDFAPADMPTDPDDDQPIRGMTPQEKADMINRALEGRGDTSLWTDPDTQIVHKIEEPKQVEEDDDRSWFARILESVGESLLYFLTGGAVDYEHSGRDMIGGDTTRWGEQQPKGTVDLSLPVGGGLASMIVPSVNVGFPGQSDKAMSMVETPVTRGVTKLLSPLYTGDKDTDGLDALKKKLDEG